MTTHQRIGVVALGVAAASSGVMAGSMPAAGQGVPGIIYAEQPTGIEAATYLAAWPALEPEIHRVQSAERAAVMHDLARRAAPPGLSDGALNLLAQLQREDGALDDADKSISQAIAMQPKQFLHHFQHAMILFAHLARASGLGRWGWQRKTTDAYQRTFDLNPRNVPARSYLAYSLALTLGIAGGDKKKARHLAQEGVDLGLVEFHVVRADVHRLRDELDAAFADYDAAIDRKVFKLNSFVAAGVATLARAGEPPPSIGRSLSSVEVRDHASDSNIVVIYEAAMHRHPWRSLCRPSALALTPNPALLLTNAFDFGGSVRNCVRSLHLWLSVRSRTLFVRRLPTIRIQLPERTQPCIDR